VAVYEPPTVSGRARAPRPVVSGEIIADRNRISRNAAAAVQRLGLARRAGMSLFRDVQPLRPTLVRVSGLQRSYYLVPFGAPGRNIQAAVIINAYTGQYEESIVLSENCFLQYVPIDIARDLAVRTFRVRPQQLGTPRLVYIPSAETPSRFFPVWQIRDVEARRDIYITPGAEAVTKLAATQEELYRRRR